MFGGKRGSDNSLGEGCGDYLLLSLSESFQTSNLLISFTFFLKIEF